jgi:hypothetical protein
MGFRDAHPLSREALPKDGLPGCRARCKEKSYSAKKVLSPLRNVAVYSRCFDALPALGEPAL